MPFCFAYIVFVDMKDLLNGSTQSGYVGKMLLEQTNSNYSIEAASLLARMGANFLNHW